MSNLINILKQQVIGVINLSLPILIIYQLNPAFLQQSYGQLFCAILIGAYVYYLSSSQAKNQANSLIFEPTGESKDEYQKTIAACGMNPTDVNLRYGYSNEMIAMTILNTVSIDPLYVADVSHDPQMIKVKDILDQHIVPGLSQPQKDRIQKIKEIYTPAVQRFIFKHELAHVHDQFSVKKTIIIGFIGGLSALIGITIALKMLLLVNGFIALIAGMFVGTISDLLLSNLSNVLFTAGQETKADTFAAKHSSKEDILAAADFFEKLQLIVDSSSDQKGLLKIIPSVVLNGHHHGFARAAHLRALLKPKSCSSC